MQTPGSLTALMVALETIEAATVAGQPADAHELSYSRWRPDSVSPPYYYHQFLRSPFTQRDQARWRDTINLAFRCGVEPVIGGEDEALDQWVYYADLWRDCFDTEFAKVGLPGTTILAGSVTRAARTDMGQTSDTFNQVSYLALELSLTFDLERQPLA